jgi:hypothetical protein
MSIGSWLKWTPALVLPALALPAAARLFDGQSAAQGAAPEARGLVRVQPGDETDAGFDRDRWAEALKVADLDQRERNYDALLDQARTDPAARKALDDWAASDDRDLAWTARLARRELGPSIGLFRSDGPFDRQGFQSRFGDLHQRLRELESMFDGFGDLGFGGPGRGGGLWIDPDFDRDGADAHAQAQSYQIEVGPDGAKVKVTEHKDGDESVREYEGKTLDELLEQNPELRGLIDVREGGTATPQAPDGPRKLWRVLSPPRTDILGIQYEPPSAETARRLGLEPDVGLVVLRTVPGTIAHILGIKRGDVLVELNEYPLYSGDDVTRVLKERLPQAEVVVTLVDAHGQRRSLTWKPSEPEPQAQQQSK